MSFLLSLSSFYYLYVYFFFLVLFFSSSLFTSFLSLYLLTTSCQFFFSDVLLACGSSQATDQTPTTATTQPLQGQRWIFNLLHLKRTPLLSIFHFFVLFLFFSSLLLLLSLSCIFPFIGHNIFPNVVTYLIEFFVIFKWNIYYSLQ